jgi:hypothetical protein
MNNIILTTSISIGFGLSTILFFSLYLFAESDKDKLRKNYDGLSKEYADLVYDYNHMLKKVPRRGAKGRFAKKA